MEMVLESYLELVKHSLSKKVLVLLRRLASLKQIQMVLVNYSLQPWSNPMFFDAGAHKYHQQQAQLKQDRQPEKMPSNHPGLTVFDSQTSLLFSLTIQVIHRYGKFGRLSNHHAKLEI